MSKTVYKSSHSYVITHTLRHVLVRERHLLKITTRWGGKHLSFLCLRRENSRWLNRSCTVIIRNTICLVSLDCFWFPCVTVTLRQIHSFINRGFSRRSWLRAGTMKQFRLKIDLCPPTWQQWRHMKMLYIRSHVRRYIIYICYNYANMSL